LTSGLRLCNPPPETLDRMNERIRAAAGAQKPRSPHRGFGGSLMAA
jgi:hypothetical protein